MSDQRSEDPITRITHHASRITALVCSLAALVLTFFGLFEFDVPLTRFVRSLNDLHVDHLHNPWLAQLSETGDRLGGGGSLVLVSVLLLAVGYIFTLPLWKRAGWETLLAHALTGLSNNALKHLIGRGRPKFMHAGSSEFSPLTGSGWDSFPSGHSMSSFAVATVLAVKFPKARSIVISVAIAIAVSRMVRGAHFLTDVAGGAGLGVLIGALVAHPWKDWRLSLESALVTMTPFMVGLLVLVWTIGNHPMAVWPEWPLMQTGLFVTIAGLVGHVALAAKGKDSLGWLSRPLAYSFMGLGLGMMAGSLLVAAAALCACLGYWLRNRSKTETPTADPAEAQDWGWAREALFVTAVLFTLLIVVEFQGALPMR